MEIKDLKKKIKVPDNNNLFKLSLDDVQKLKAYFNKKTFYGITGVGVAVLLGIYFLVYLDYTERTDEIETSNKSLQATVNELQKYSDNMQSYQSEINNMKTDIEDILKDYPAGVREEDILMLAVQLQTGNQIGYSAISMEENEDLYIIPYSEVSLAAIEGMDDDLSFSRKEATYVTTTTYEDLKSVISEIYASDNRIGVNSIIFTKDEEDGTLDGNIDLYFYYATGTGKEYQIPDIAAYIAGTGDIFNSGKSKTSQEESDAQEGEEADENAEEDAQTTQEN